MLPGASTDSSSSTVATPTSGAVPSNAEENGPTCRSMRSPSTSSHASPVTHSAASKAMRLTSKPAAAASSAKRSLAVRLPGPPTWRSGYGSQSACSRWLVFTRGSSRQGRA